jgi:Sec-independent protein translocase protein TatA
MPSNRIDFDVQMTIAPAIILALGNLGGQEILFILTLTLLLVGGRRLPELAAGFAFGIKECRHAVREIRAWLRWPDQEAHDAGESIGGIYGKAGAQAITPDTQIAELYDPEVFRKSINARGRNGRKWVLKFKAVWDLIKSLIFFRANPDKPHRD